MPVENSEENSEKCLCPGCPSHDECMKGKNEVLYCARNKSACEVPMNGCLCGNCPVHHENKLTSGYYCTNGKVA